MLDSTNLALRIKQTAKAQGVSVKTLLAECELNKNTLSTMQSSGYYPRLEAIAKIADKLCVSVDFLLGRSEEVEVKSDLTENQKELMSMIQALPDDKVAGILAILRSV